MTLMSSAWHDVVRRTPSDAGDAGGGISRRSSNRAAVHQDVVSNCTACSRCHCPGQLYSTSPRHFSLLPAAVEIIHSQHFFKRIQNAEIPPSGLTHIPVPGSLPELQHDFLVADLWLWSALLSIISSFLHRGYRCKEDAVFNIVDPLILDPMNGIIIPRSNSYIPCARSQPTGQLYFTQQPCWTSQSTGGSRTVPNLRRHRASGDVNTRRARLHHVSCDSGWPGRQC